MFLRRVHRFAIRPFALSIFLGLFFLVSAALKAASSLEFAVQVSYYEIVRAPWLVRLVALGVIGLEAGLGGALIVCARSVRVRRRLLFLSLALLVVFSALLVWGWWFRNLEDCGCFGKYLKMTPGWSIAKNGVLLFVVVLALRSSGRGESFSPSEGAVNCAPLFRRMFSLNLLGRASLVGAGAIAAMASAIVGLPVGENQGRGAHKAGRLVTDNAVVNKDGGAVFDFSGWGDEERGEWFFVSMLSESCNQCADIVQVLNEMTQNPDMPPIRVFVLGSGEELAAFRQKYRPHFATRSMSPLEFLSRIGDSPPRFHLVRSGRSLRYWDERIPDMPTVLDAVLDGM